MGFKDAPFESIKDSWLLGLFKRKITKTETFMQRSVRIGKNTEMLHRYIKTVQSGKTAIIIGPNYVVMDRETYDKLPQVHIKEGFDELPRK